MSSFTSNLTFLVDFNDTTMAVDTFNTGLFYVPTGLVVLLSVIYGSISVVTVIGNALVILVIVKNRRMQTVTNFFIANLSVADVVIGILSTPFQFQAALLQRWDLPDLLCPISPFVKELSVNVSIITLTVISIDRYFAVVHPLRPGWSAATAVAIMVVVWTISAVSSLPTAIAFSVILQEDEFGNPKPFCYPEYPTLLEVDTSKVYCLYMVVVQYFLPLIVITFAYSCIMYRIWIAKAPGSAMDARDKMMNKNKKKVIKMLVVVVVLFAFCWMPLQIYNLLSMLAPDINSYRYINIIWFCSNWLAMSNSCYNPFIYGLLNEKFKHGFKQLFRKSPCHVICSRKAAIEDPFAVEVSEASMRRTYSSTYHHFQVQHVQAQTRKQASWRCSQKESTTNRSYV